MEEVLYKRHPVYTHLFCGLNGQVYSTKSKGFKTQYKTPNGYCRLRIGVEVCYVHRLIIQAHKGMSVLHVDHLNRDRSNNNISNLEYVTQKENNRRIWERGYGKTNIIGDKNPNSFLTSIQINEIRENSPTSLQQRRELAGNFGISLRLLRDILNRKTWKHLP